MSTPRAAIDCGTNSTRLLIHDGESTLERLMTITGLGQGIGNTKRLAPDAIERTVSCLRKYRAVMDKFGVANNFRITATSAARDTTNRDDFFEAAQQAVGRPPELLSGQEEARLAFAGATSELDSQDGPWLAVDIGGGSTEFAFGTAGECEAAISVDIGCVRLTEQFIKSDPPDPSELLACLSITEAHLDDVVRLMPEVWRAKTFVGLAGTVSSAAAVEIGLVEYDSERIHHFKLTKQAAEDVYRTLVTERREDRRHNPGLEPERVDVIVGGMCILVKIMRYFDIEEFLVSETDLLDGLIADT